MPPNGGCPDRVDKMFTVKQAAAELGVSVSLMYALISARKIAHERHGLGRGVIRVTAEALENYRRSRTTEAGSDPRPPAPRPPVRPGFRHLRL